MYKMSNITLTITPVDIESFAADELIDIMIEFLDALSDHPEYQGFKCGNP